MELKNQNVPNSSYFFLIHGLIHDEFTTKEQAGNYIFIRSITYLASLAPCDFFPIPKIKMKHGTYFKYIKDIKT